MKILTGLEVGRVLLTQEAFVLISPLEMWLKQSRCLQVFPGRCFTNNF